jgi:NitT/TauT family transport system ATP-binding protein
MIPATLRGKISVLGKEPKNLRAGELDMVFQENCLLPWRSAVLNICLGAEIIHDGSSSPIGLLEQVGLVGFEKALPKQLSGGMKQRVSLGASLITHPEILLMDEPFASLDALTKERLWQLMEDLRLRQLIHTGLIVTHSIEEAVVLSDRVLVMSPRPGKIIAEVVINLPKPRINQDGLFISGFGDICNQIRVHVRRGER